MLCDGARETHWTTCHNGVTPSKTKEFLKSPRFFDLNGMIFLNYGFYFKLSLTKFFQENRIIIVEVTLIFNIFLSHFDTHPWVKLIEITCINLYSRSLIHIVDWTPTILSFANISIPLNLDGIDQSEIFYSKKARPRKRFVYGIQVRF